MSLNVAFNQARQSIQSINAQFAVSGRNVAGAGDPEHSRAAADVVTTFQNGARIVGISRNENAALYGRLITATSASAGQRALADGLERLGGILGDPADGNSPAARIGALSAALTDFSNDPTVEMLGQTVLAEARDLSRGLNEAADTVVAVRQSADDDIATAVDRLNDLLAEFRTVNDAIVRGTQTGRDVTTLLDRRDGIVKDISEEIGVTTVLREADDMALFTESGVTLFDKVARDVAFAPTTYAAGVVGNAVFVDGIPVAGPGAIMEVESGRIRGLVDLRDEAAVIFETQLDEIARGLVVAFREVDQVGGGPDLAGLFTDGGAAVLPGGFTPGLAGRIAVNAAADPNAGGDLLAIRNGGMNGVDYTYNRDPVTGLPANFSGFSGRLQELADAVAAPFAFDPAAQLPTSTGVETFASNSVGWLEDRRSGALDEADYTARVADRAFQALSNAVGVNLDDEYAFQLELERSFAASSSLINTIDGLFQILLRDVR